MKTTFIPPIISKILGLKNAAGTTINPATEESLQAIADKIGNENLSAAAVASAVRTNLSVELARIDQPISSRATPGDLTTITAAEIWEYTTRTLTESSGGGGGGGGGLLYAVGGQTDTKALERSLKAVEDQLAKEPQKYTKALEDAQKAIVDTIKKMPAPKVTVNAPQVPTVTVPSEFLAEIKTAVETIKQTSDAELQKNTEKYDAIVGIFKRTVLEEISKTIIQDKSGFDTIIESAILRASAEFASILQHMEITETESNA